MTPLFQDHVRPQFIVNLMTTGAPQSQLSRYTLESYTALMKKGQDAAHEFLVNGSLARPNSPASSLTLCPTGQATSADVCKGSGM